MEKWEHGMLGWFVDGTRAVYYWRRAGEDIENLGDARGMHVRMGELGPQGWEMTAASSSELSGETMYFKRRSSE